MSEVICEGIVNTLVVTNSTEANMHLTRIHEHIFARKRSSSYLHTRRLIWASAAGDPAVASVWRRQTFSAAVDDCSPHMSQMLLQEQMPSLMRLLYPNHRNPTPAVNEIMDSAYAFSRMLHASRSSSGGITDAFYRAYVPELASVLYPRQIELVKRCLRSEYGDVDRVGSCIFFGLVKMTRTPDNAPPGPNGEVPELSQAVVRRAQVICECALGMVGAASAGGAPAPGPIHNYPAQPPPPHSYGTTPPPPHSFGPTPPASYAGSPPPHGQLGAHGRQSLATSPAPDRRGPSPARGHDLPRSQGRFATPPPSDAQAPGGRPPLRLNI